MKPRLPSGPRPPPTGDGPAERRGGPDRGRRLALVAPEAEPLAPASEDELRAARDLAEALDRGEVPLAAALRAAARPVGLDRADHEALLARALGDEGAPPTKAELRAAERLRKALDPARLREALDPGAAGGAGIERGGSSGELASPGARDELAELAVALRAAWRPAPLAELRNRALVEGALRAAPAPRARRIAPVTMAALSTLAAAAAAAALIFGQLREERASVARAPGAAAAPVEAAAPRLPLIEARSTAALFDPAAPFPREGGQTERIDRIAAARASDLRQNRYAAWGVR
ncbi:hypothetical protein [Sorangium cellulosum]|uniref:hypothetical protein n=1 Tax=Sorangium cellulosum TaxID=56 RepID=UPI00041D4FB6|nr:hypothetical protein [Sorangium cellulosum]